MKMDLTLSEPNSNDPMPQLEELSRCVAEDVKSYQDAMLTKDKDAIYDSAYYILIAERVGSFFKKVDWEAFEQCGDSDRFIEFLSFNEPFLKSFMDWGDICDGIDASSVRSIEDEIFTFLIGKTKGYDEDDM